MKPDKELIAAMVLYNFDYISVNFHCKFYSLKRLNSPLLLLIQNSEKLSPLCPLFNLVNPI